MDWPATFQKDSRLFAQTDLWLSPLLFQHPFFLLLPRLFLERLREHCRNNIRRPIRPKGQPEPKSISDNLDFDSYVFTSPLLTRLRKIADSADFTRDRAEITKSLALLIIIYPILKIDLNKYAVIHSFSCYAEIFGDPLKHFPEYLSFFLLENGRDSARRLLKRSWHFDCLS